MKWERTEGERGGVVAQAVYEIRVVGPLGPAAREAFDGFEVEVEPSATVLTGEMDQAALLGLIDRIRALGLELIDIKRTRPQRPAHGEP